MIPHAPQDNPSLRLPGSDLVCKGIDDLKQSQGTQEAFLVALAATRLSDLGVSLPEQAFLIRRPDIALYDAVCEAGGGHSQYNALVRRLTSFMRAYAKVSLSQRAETDLYFEHPPYYALDVALR